MKVAGAIAQTAGHRLLSDMGRALFTIVADTVGHHDTIGGCCSAESNALRYGVVGTPSYNPASGGRPTPIRLVTWEPVSS